MSDWESESDEEREVEKEVGRGGGGTADGTCPILTAPWQFTHGDHRRSG